jgi:hypothetical protein
MNYLRNAETGAETVVVDAGTDTETSYYKLSDTVHNWEYDSMLIKVSRPITDEEMLQLAQLTGYAFSVLAGEGLGWPERASEDSFTVWTDSTKCRNRNFEEFSDKLQSVVTEGTPIRKTNRAGEGTKGTRKVQGMPDVAVDLYLDEVFSFKN